MKTGDEPAAEFSITSAAPLVHSKEELDTEMGADCRPLAYWLVRYPPGWISRLGVAEARPLELAKKIQRLTADFVGWLRLPRTERWDTFGLQVLSAKLFSRYRVDGKTARSVRSELGLLELTWPEGTDAIQCSLADLQELLAPPLAVYKAVRSAATTTEFPSEAEVSQADDILWQARDEIAAISERLDVAIAQYEVTKHAVADSVVTYAEALGVLNPRNSKSDPLAECPSPV